MELKEDDVVYIKSIDEHWVVNRLVDKNTRVECKGYPRSTMPVCECELVRAANACGKAHGATS